MRHDEYSYSGLISHYFILRKWDEVEQRNIEFEDERREIGIRGNCPECQELLPWLEEQRDKALQLIGKAVVLSATAVDPSIGQEFLEALT